MAFEAFLTFSSSQSWWDKISDYILLTKGFRIYDTSIANTSWMKFPLFICFLISSQVKSYPPPFKIKNTPCRQSLTLEGGFLYFMISLSSTMDILIMLFLAFDINSSIYSMLFFISRNFEFLLLKTIYSSYSSVSLLLSLSI